MSKLKLQKKVIYFYPKKVNTRKGDIYIFSDSFHKPNETTAEESIKEGSCKGKTCIKITKYKYSSI